MDKQGVVTAVAIVAFVAVGAVIMFAVAIPLGNASKQTGTLQGLEQEQSGNAIPGNQPGSDSGTTTAGTQQPFASFNGNSTSGTNNSSSAGQSGANTTGSIAGDNPSTPSDNPYSDFT